MYYYVYKIILTNGELKNHFYYGKHKTNKLNDGYKGSGVVLKQYYKDYPNDYEKEILYFFDNQNDCDDKEYDLIANNIHNPLCVNKMITHLGGDVFHNLSEEKQLELKSKFSENGKNWWNSLSDDDKKLWSKHVSEAQKGRQMSEEHYKNFCEAMKLRRGQPSPMKGKNHTDESKKLISEHNWTKQEGNEEKLKEMGRKISERWKKQGHPKGMLGKHQSEEYKIKKAKYKWINNGEEELQIHIDNIDNYLNNGYVYGRLPGKIGAGNKGMKKMTNDIDTVFVKPDKFDIYISNGYRFCYLPS